MEYFSKGAGAAALTTGIVGSVGTLANTGILGNILGGSNCCRGSVAVTRYDLDTEKELAAKDSKIALLESTIYTDGKLRELEQRTGERISVLEAQIAQQAVVNTQISANLSCQQQSIAQLLGLTKTIIPVDNICPTPTVATTTGA